jgi:putative FmdB family regulatory protein
MPIYEYRCRQCNHIFDAFQKVGEDGAELKCPACATLKPEKLFSSFAAPGSEISEGGYTAGAGCGSHGAFT